MTAPQTPPIASSGEGIPAGMKRWYGGDAAPMDYDDGPVCLRDGTIWPVPPARWWWVNQNSLGKAEAKPHDMDVVAYTPRTPPAASSGQDLREALRFIAAARDFANAGKDKFHPGYSQYVDLLEAAETLARFDAREAVLDLPFANTAPIEWGEYEWSRFKAALLSAPAVRPGGDLVVVPREPTEAMIEAGAKAYNAPPGYEADTACDATRCWAAMLAAATPQPEAEEGE